MLYLITKLQNLKAIHNLYQFLKEKPKVVSNYKITKSESYSQHFWDNPNYKKVVSNYKITKSESYSQRMRAELGERISCI